MLIIRRGRMEGFIILDYLDRFPEAQAEMAGWLAAGEIKSAEHIVEGLEHAPDALNLLFTGGNTGKVIVKVCALCGPGPDGRLEPQPHGQRLELVDEQRFDDQRAFRRARCSGSA